MTKIYNINKEYRKLVRTFIPIVTSGNTNIDFIRDVLRLDEDEEYDPVEHWPRYEAVRSSQMALAVLNDNERHCL